MTAACGKGGCTSRMHDIMASSIAVSLVILIANPTAAADHNRGAQLAAICAACHRLDGRDRGIPSIIALSQEQLVGALQAFKSGERSSQIMHAVALLLNDEEILTVAHYLAERREETQQQ